jgi:hypothetical protein
MMMRATFVVVLRLLSASCCLPAAASGAGGTEDRARAPDAFSTPAGAMAALVRAIHDRNVPRVLACFSRTKPWYVTTTGGKKALRSRYTFAQLETGLKDGGDFRGVLLGDDPDDNLRDQIEETGRRPWRARGPATFVPPDDDTVNVFVKWRTEGNRYVVEEIAFPGA